MIIEVRGINIFSKTDIPSSSIIARINYRNGASYFRPFINQQFPLKWQKKKWNEWVNETKGSSEWKEIWRQY